MGAAVVAAHHWFRGFFFFTWKVSCSQLACARHTHESCWVLKGRCSRQCSTEGLRTPCSCLGTSLCYPPGNARRSASEMGVGRGGAGGQRTARGHTDRIPCRPRCSRGSTRYIHCSACSGGTGWGWEGQEAAAVAVAGPGTGMAGAGVALVSGLPSCNRNPWALDSTQTCSALMGKLSHRGSIPRQRTSHHRGMGRTRPRHKSLAEVVPPPSPPTYRCRHHISTADWRRAPVAYWWTRPDRSGCAGRCPAAACPPSTST
jgi:hypothetical protein